METKVFEADQLAAAAALLQAGEVVAFPTETVYGLGADATNPAAVQKVFDAKHRPADNPLIVTVATPAMVAQYAQVSPLAATVMDRFWPGPLTIILPVLPRALPRVVTGGLETAAFRLPDSALTRQLIEMTGVPLVGPSANLSGTPSATMAAHVLHDFDGVIAGVVDDGPTTVGVESTVLDLTVTPPAILRPGQIDAQALAPVIGPVEEGRYSVGAKEAPKAPGMKYTHYAPQAAVVIVADPNDFPAALQAEIQRGEVFGVLATDDVLTTVPVAIPTYSLGEDVEAATHNLFAGLRWFDLHPTITRILAQGFPATEGAVAYMNRLTKAAGNQHFRPL